MEWDEWIGFNELIRLYHPSSSKKTTDTVISLLTIVFIPTSTYFRLTD